MDKSQYIQAREYEMMAVLLPDQGEEETTAAIDKMLSYITDENGTVDSVNAESPWGRRRLAYTIRHEGVDYRDGHYVLVYFTAMPSAIAEIERELKLDTNVIRYLLLIHDPEMGEKFDESAIAEEDEDADEGTETEAAPATEVAEASETEEAPAEESDPVEETASEEEETPEDVPAETVPEAEPADEETEAEAEESDKE